MKFLMNQSVSSNPPFFFCVSYRRLFVPAARSKVAELDSQSFFGEILPPCGCGDFPETLQGLKLCHSNLRFTFATGTIKHQARGDKSGAFGKRIRSFGLLPFPPLRQGELIIRLIGISARKSSQNIADEKKKSAVTTCNTECPCGFQFASEDSRFLSSADSRACLIALSVSCTPTRL